MTRVIVADLFCGAGGSSTGAELAIHELGLELELACVNHWPVAIETHRLNHPTARHYIEDVGTADPEKIVPGRYLDLLMASPECTYHSNARGGKPIHEQNRMDPWAVLNWLTRLDVRCVLIENVPEFRAWGPLNAEGKPDKSRKGQYFEAWVQAIWGLGYQTDWRLLNAADFGDATTRTRFFLQARKDGRPLTWPEPTHGQQPDPMFGRRRWRAAREIIDWSKRGRSVLDDPRYQKKPLSENTRRRMAAGLQRFGGLLAPLYINLLGVDGNAAPVPGAGEPVSFVMGKQSSPLMRTVDEPIPTLTTESAPMVIEPVADLVGANRAHNMPRPIDQPVPAATSAAGGGLYVVEASVEPFMLGQQSGGAPRPTDEPAPTIATDGAISLVEPLILPYYRTGVADSTDEPLATVTTRERFGIAQAVVVPYGPRADVRPVDAPLHTVTTKDRFGLAETTAVMVPFFGERDGQKPRAHDVNGPLPTVTSHGAGALDEAVVMQTAPHAAETVGARAVDSPLYTATTIRRQGLVEPMLVQTDHSGSDGVVRPVAEPVPTLVTKANVGLAEPVLVTVNHDGNSGRVHSPDEPLPTTTTKRCVALAEPVLEEIRAGRIDRRRLVIIDDRLCMLDIRFRMLDNDELAAAMGFTDDERTYEFVGNKSEVTKQIGNAVAVGTARALVKAVLG